MVDPSRRVTKSLAPRLLSQMFQIISALIRGMSSLAQAHLALHWKDTAHEEDVNQMTDGLGSDNVQFKP